MTAHARKTNHVWGKLPQIVLNKLTPSDLAVLRKYISKIQNRVYRIAFDNGHCYGIEECAKVADQEATALKSEIGCDPYAKARVIVVAHCIRALAQQPPAGEKK